MDWKLLAIASKIWSTVQTRLNKIHDLSRKKMVKNQKNGNCVKKGF
jgi:hypothetical protein